MLVRALALGVISALWFVAIAGFVLSLDVTLKCWSAVISTFKGVKEMARRKKAAKLERPAAEAANVYVEREMQRFLRLEAAARDQLQRHHVLMQPNFVVAPMDQLRNEGMRIVRVGGGGAGGIAGGGAVLRGYDIPPMNERERARMDARAQHFALLGRITNGRWNPKTKQIAANLPIEEHFDEQGRYHREDGPALIVEGGSPYYFWHGLDITEIDIARPPTRARIEENVSNMVYRHALLQMYRGDPALRLDYEHRYDGLDGYKRYLHETKRAPLDVDPGIGTLWQVVIKHPNESTMAWTMPPRLPITCVEVENATQEKDGTRKRFYLRVPDRMRTALEAVAWTFNMTPEQYKPLIQS